MKIAGARSNSIRILIADDHDVVRHGIKAILEQREGWTICAEAKSGPEAIALTEKHRPDTMVMDLNMPGLSGIDTLRELRRRLLSPKAVILTLHYSAALLQTIVQAGALGYVLKSDADRDLIAAVEAVSQGKPYFTPYLSKVAENRAPHAAAESLPHFVPAAAPPPLVAGQLTSREREAVRSLAQTMRRLL